MKRNRGEKKKKKGGRERDPHHSHSQMGGFGSVRKKIWNPFFISFLGTTSRNVSEHLHGEKALAEHSPVIAS